MDIAGHSLQDASFFVVAPRRPSFMMKKVRYEPLNSWNLAGTCFNKKLSSQRVCPDMGELTDGDGTVSASHSPGKFPFCVVAAARFPELS